MTLTEFLLARIAEDEAVARDAQAANIHTVAHEHMERWDPPCVLAECAAKRRIVELHPRSEWHHPASELINRATGRPYTEGGDSLGGCEVCGTDHPDAPWPCGTLAALALPYADHPDFLPEWAPTAGR